MDDSQDPLPALQEAVGQLGANRLQALNDLKEIQILNQVLLQREAGRLKHKLGEDHPRVQQAQARLQHNMRLVKEMEVNVEMASITVPDVQEEGALVHGRIVDENDRGLAGLVVFLTNQKGKAISALGSAESADSGYYALPQAAETVARYRETAVYLTICTREGKVVYRHTPALTLGAGDRAVVDAVLNRADLTPVDAKPPVDGDEDGEELGPNVWAVRGRVLDANGQGIEGLTVSLYDKDLIFDDRLGTTLTYAKGEYRIIYLTDDFRDLFEDKSDLFLKVMDKEGKTLYSSRKSVRYEAGRMVRFDVTITRKNYRK